MLFVKLLSIGLSILLLYGCATARHDSDPFAIREIADKAYMDGKWNAAEKLYLRLTNLVPEDAYAYFRLGNSLVRQHKFNQAIESYTEALIRDPSLGKIYSNISAVYLIKARLALEEAIKRLPKGSPASEQAHMRLKVLNNSAHIPQ